MRKSALSHHKKFVKSLSQSGIIKKEIEEESFFVPYVAENVCFDVKNNRKDNFSLLINLKYNNIK